MSSNEIFQRNLTYGEEAEDIVYQYLIKNNSGVVDLRKQKRDENGGPRMVGTEGSFVLPDFGVYNKNPKKGTYSVDVKRKRSLYTYKGRECFTVDKKFEQYKKTSQIMGFDFVAIIFFYEDRMYFYKDTDCIGFEYKVNDYGTGNIYYFSYDENKLIY